MATKKITDIPQAKTEPDFENLLKVLRCQKPNRPTLFEFFLNKNLEERIITRDDPSKVKPWSDPLRRGLAFRQAGYDYVIFTVPGFVFPRPQREHKSSISMSHGGVITDRASFKACAWQNPDDAQYQALDEVAAELPSGMKIIPSGPGGVEENAIELIGFEELCFMMADDPDLTQEIFDKIGSSLLRYYELAAAHRAVGACMVNDDWGFKTQTLLSVAQMRKYVFPWHQKIVAAIHKAGKPAILHSCGYYEQIVDIMIDELKFDARHSYEDAIEPVEKAYERFKGRMAVLGGIDVDFVCRSTPEQVYQRSSAMLKQGASSGYALGTGNSVPEYVPHDHYFAMINAALHAREG
ncbi:MAG: uroporphyrinogen decarboxylase family protein [Verrucomicrobiae bacterium]|nr:uroporphyrinogen decarboxylase family protein [Verrucomicrobiae bacterium]